ncbi:MAG TPA: TRAP transporter large permease subunit [Clostridiales bacterium]|nr:TRAP transporter large permease subunit [Clostridiales bacterium]
MAMLAPLLNMTMIGPLPIEVFYLILVLAFVMLLFILFKRPIYETMFLAFCFSVVMTGKYNLFFKHLVFPATQSNLFYIIVSFLALAYILEKTKVVEKLIRIILAIFGGLPGGAGYVALFGSAALATMTGTGPGNVAATGVFTIPAMIKSGFSRELAATTEASCSMLGNQMGPGLNLVGFGILAGLYPAANYNLATFWIALWIVGGWLVVQRLITLIILCKREGVKPIPREERPRFREALKNGWDSLLLPLIILFPIIFSSQASGFIQARLGVDGEAAFSSIVLMFTVGVCTVYALITGRKKIAESEGAFNVKVVYNMFKNSLRTVVPVGATIYFAYAMSNVFKEVAMADAMQTWVTGLGLSKLGWTIVVVLFTGILGMVLPGSSQVALLGGAIISTGAAVGIDPFLVAAVMPAITGVMEGMTPPLALAMFTGMGIAKSEFWPTAKKQYIWVLGNIIATILLFMGILPIFIKG